jgi:phosphoribosylformylglycinamidine cyclo-ligase
MSSKESKTYAGSGVDLEYADQLSDHFSKLLPTTFRKGCMPWAGGFAGMFDLKREGLDDAILVMATDGVGTKLKLASQFEIYGGVGIDLVAMSVNDILTCGGEPLCFLDYVAFSELKKGVLEEIVEGVVDGCKQSGCALAGGETAEMPGMYEAGHFDLAGFAVGAAKRDRIIDGSGIEAGDVVIGLASSGVHSNGFSLVRAILSDMPAAEVEKLKPMVMQPTQIYVKHVLPHLAAEVIKGMAHITGGGIAGNLKRVIPDGLQANIELKSWPTLEVFDRLQKAGNVDQQAMLRTFNMGVGYILVCKSADLVGQFDGLAAWQIGTIEKRQNDDEAVVIR